MPNTLSLINDTSLKESSALTKYIAEINKFPILTEDEEIVLLDKFVNDKHLQSGHKILNSHLRLVVKIAYQHKKFYNSILDMIAEGNLGLMKALKNFSLNKKVRFSTYAILWIKASIQEFILRSISIVRIGSTAAQKRIIFGLSKVKKALRIIDGKSYNENIDKVLDYLNVEKADLINISAEQDLSLSQRLSEDGTMEFEETIQSDTKNPEEEFIVDERRMLITNAIKQLNDREKEIFTTRRLSEKGQTLQYFATKFDISVERVRQIEAKAIEKIKKIAAERLF